MLALAIGHCSLVIAHWAAILGIEAPAALHSEEQLLDGHLPILPGKDTMAAD